MEAAVGEGDAFKDKSRRRIDSGSMAVQRSMSRTRAASGWRTCVVVRGSGAYLQFLCDPTLGSHALARLCAPACISRGLT
jgi:hypothetical protein